MLESCTACNDKSLQIKRTHVLYGELAHFGEVVTTGLYIVRFYLLLGRREDRKRGGREEGRGMMYLKHAESNSMNPYFSSDSNIRSIT